MTTFDDTSSDSSNGVDGTFVDNSGAAGASENSSSASEPQLPPAEPAAQANDSSPGITPTTDAALARGEPDALAKNAIALHAAINAIAPIDGVSGVGDNMAMYRIDFKPDATPEQISEAQAFLANWPVYRDRQRAIAAAQTQIDEWFTAQIAEGCAVSAGFVLGMTNNDVILLTGNYVLSQTVAALGAPLPDIIDTAGVPHQLENLESLTQIMLEYGQYRASLSALYAAKKAELAEAIANLPALTPAPPPPVN
jgi:hypothetical protein